MDLYSLLVMIFEDLSSQFFTAFFQIGTAANIIHALCD